jgi:imidazoleglycerol phosphate dehydratase HisB
VRSLTARRAEVRRRTRETELDVRVNLDEYAPIAISTGIGFLDHMLEQLASHGGFALELTCKGDLEVDEHHTVEDCALAFGEALRRALGPKTGIARYGFVLPMDEAQAQVAIDLSGRPFARFSGGFNRESVGGLPTELVPHFFRSLADSLGAAIHVSVAGDNSHHMIECCFKGVGRSLRQAIKRESAEIPSTKGVL